MCELSQKCPKQAWFKVTFKCNEKYQLTVDALKGQPLTRNIIFL